LTINLPTDRLAGMVDTRTKILDIAEDLVKKVGLNAMSYKDISEAVGIRKASVHYHFPKEENLVDGLLDRCAVSYGDNYQRIVDGSEKAPDKLRELAAVFADGLNTKKLCLVGSISADRNTLQDSSFHILQSTIKKTVSIFATVFEQGRQEQSLTFTGTEEDTAFAFFSLLVGSQIIARSHGGIQLFQQAAEGIISGFEK